MSLQDYTELAAEFVEILEGRMPIAEEKGMTYKTQIIRKRLDEIIGDVNITQESKEFITHYLTCHVLVMSELKCFPGRTKKTLDLFGIDLQDNKYGFFDPTKAERIEINMLEFYKNNFGLRGIKSKLKKREKLGKWESEFKEKYGHDPTQ